jgi:GntR family transcriptional regulator
MTQKPLALHLDFRSGLPIYIQIMNQIESQVLGGTLKPGDQLPTVRAMASELRVNFNTVARAYRMLDAAPISPRSRGQK